MDKNNIFGSLLLKLRTEKGLYQWEVAARSGLTQAYISQLEAGIYIPSLPVAMKVARSLGIQPYEMVKMIQEIEAL